MLPKHFGMGLVVSVIAGCEVGDNTVHHFEPQLASHGVQRSDAGSSSVPTEVLSLIDELYAIYQREAEALGKQLTITITESPTSTAMVIYDRWELRASRTLLSEPISTDVVATILCHELGHLHGGYPFKPASPVSAEPQADYFAGKECLPRLWQGRASENAGYRANVDASVREQCDLVWLDAEQRDVCYRVAHAAEEFGAWEASRRTPSLPVPDLSTPDPTVVSATFFGYPTSQCRVDTLFQGGLCTIKNTTGAQPDACPPGEPGARPSCWFAD